MRKYKYSLFILQGIACLVFFTSCSSTATNSHETDTDVSSDELTLWRELSEMRSETLDYIPMLLGEGDRWVLIKMPTGHKIKLLRVDKKLSLWKRYNDLSWNATKKADYPSGDLRLPPSYVYVFPDSSGLSVYSGLSGSLSGTNYFTVLYWNKTGGYWYSTHALPAGYYFNGDVVVNKGNIKVSIKPEDADSRRDEYITIPVQKEKSPNLGPRPKPSSKDPEDFPVFEGEEEIVDKDDPPVLIIPDIEADE